MRLSSHSLSLSLYVYLCLESMRIYLMHVLELQNSR